jgi:hypothetical protein
VESDLLFSLDVKVLKRGAGGSLVSVGALVLNRDERWLRGKGIGTISSGTDVW